MVGDGISVAKARFLGAGIAGCVELPIFHPADTAAKRLMTSPDSFNRANWRAVIFQDKALLGARARLMGLYPGVGIGAAFKITQRIQKFGGQPYVKEYVKGFCKVESKGGKTFCDGLAGSLMGAGEVVLLPLEVLKIKRQTNPDFRTKGLAAITGQTLGSLYAGWQWTLARNVPGSFALFGANAAVKEYVFHLQDHRDASLLQTAASSFAGSVSSILVACPFDVVKTRVQSGTFGNEGGIAIVGNIVKKEGFGAFFKGAVPKLLTVGPKLMFSFTLAQHLMTMFERR